MMQKRAGWLTALFLGEMLTATAMGVFEKEIAKAVVLALFVPLIISSGGNAGSQASTLVIRALALGEVTLGDWWRIMRREMFAGLALGTILGVDRLPAHHDLVAVLARSTAQHWLLVARHRRHCARRHRALGHADRVAAAAPAAAARLRSRDVVCAVCRDARGRDGTGDLLQRRDGDPAGLAIVTPLSAVFGLQSTGPLVAVDCRP